MFRFLLTLPILVYVLYAKEADLLEFTCIAASEFSIELKRDKDDAYSTNILMHEFDSYEIKQNKRGATKIDSLELVINDLNTSNSIDRVYIWSTFSSAENEIELNNSLNQKERLLVTSDRNAAGKQARTVLKSGSIVREIPAGQSISPAEVHRITFNAKKNSLRDKKSGIYEGQIHFVAVGG